MAAERKRTGAIQDTGNPVLDSTVNLLMNWPSGLHPERPFIEGLHKLMLELYQKEPSGYSSEQDGP